MGLLIGAYVYWTPDDDIYSRRLNITQEIGLALSLPSFMFSQWAKPRRTDFGYKCFLLLQGLVFAGSFEVPVALLDKKEGIYGTLIRVAIQQIIVRFILLWGLIGYGSWKIRRFIGALGDTELSTFLTDKLLFEGFNSLLIAAYFTFEPAIMRDGETSKLKMEEECMTLYRATFGLNIFLVFYIFITLVLGHSHAKK